jgi:hypothetical protein
MRSPFSHSSIGGRLEQTYNPDFKPDDAAGWLTPIAEYTPKYYKY